jgi:hypothetical protein
MAVWTATFQERRPRPARSSHRGTSVASHCGRHPILLPSSRCLLHPHSLPLGPSFFGTSDELLRNDNSQIQRSLAERGSLYA